MRTFLSTLRRHRRSFALSTLIFAGQAVAASKLFAIDFACTTVCLWYYGDIAVRDGRVYSFSDCSTLGYGSQVEYVCYYT